MDKSADEERSDARSKIEKIDVEKVELSDLDASSAPDFKGGGFLGSVISDPSR